MRRLALISAVTYAAAVVVGLFVVPAAPHVTASGNDVVRYYQDHDSGARLVAWLGAVSLIPLSALLASLRRTLTGAARDLFQIGSSCFVALTLVWLWIGASLALHARHLTPEAARAIADVAAFFAPTVTVAVILLTASVGWEAWSSRSRLPRWFTILSLIVASEQVIETVTITSTHGFTAPGGTMNFTLGASLFLVWVLAAGYTVSMVSKRDWSATAQLP